MSIWTTRSINRKRHFISRRIIIFSRNPLLLTLYPFDKMQRLCGLAIILMLVVAHTCVAIHRAHSESKVDRYICMIQETLKTHYFLTAVRLRPRCFKGCGIGKRCVLPQVQCVKAPCYPIRRCDDDIDDSVMK